MASCNSLRPIGKFSGHLVNFAVFCYMFPFWYILPRKLCQLWSHWSKGKMTFESFEWENSAEVAKESKLDSRIRMIEKWSKSDRKVIENWSKSDWKVIENWSKIDRKVIEKWSKSCKRIKIGFLNSHDRKLIEKWLKIARKLLENWSKIDRKVISDRKVAKESKLDSWIRMIEKWITFLNGKSLKLFVREI
jgi:hypothetical protein